MQRLFSIRAGAEHQSVSSHWEVTRPRPRATKANAQQSDAMRVGGGGGSELTLAELTLFLFDTTPLLKQLSVIA